jgi:hypothetical protein
VERVYLQEEGKEITFLSHQIFDEIYSRKAKNPKKEIANFN